MASERPLAIGLDCVVWPSAVLRTGILTDQPQQLICWHGILVYRMSVMHVGNVRRTAASEGSPYCLEELG